MRLIAFCLLAGLAFLSEPLNAQTYPSRPIKIIVPYPAGGSSDALARQLGNAISEAVGQPVVVENKAGGGTLIGTEAVSTAEPDGYTLLYTTTLALNQLLYESNAARVKEFSPIALIATVPLLLTVHPAVPASLDGLVEHSKRNPDKINFVSFGPGTIPDLACKMFSDVTGAKMTGVAYKGGAPALQDLLRGEIHVFCDNLGTGSRPHIQAGSLRAVALFSEQRSELMPNLPTFVELGRPELSLPEVSHELYAPVGTPPAIVARLNEVVNRVLATGTFPPRIQALGGKVAGGSPERLRDAIQKDRKRWEDIIKRVSSQPAAKN